MKIHHLLYSRSKDKDYRWIIIPAFISDNDRKQLRELYNLYDEYKEKDIILHAEVPLFFCMTLNNSIILVNCIRTKYNDSNFRPIFCMQGIAVQRENAMDFSQYIKYLLYDYITCYDKSVINIWNRIDIEFADSITKDSIEDTISIDIISKRISEINNNTIKSFLDLFAAFKAEHLDFAFGVPYDMLRNFNYLFKIIFPIYGNKKEENNLFLPKKDNFSTRNDCINDLKDKSSIIEIHNKNYIANFDDCNVKLRRCKKNKFYILNFSENEKYQFTLEDNHGSLIEESGNFERLDAKKMLTTFNDFVKMLEQKGWSRIQEKEEIWWEVKLRQNKN